MLSKTKGNIIMKKYWLFLLLLLIMLFIVSCKDDTHYSFMEEAEYEESYQKIYNDNKYLNNESYRIINNNSDYDGYYTINKEDTNIVFIYTGSSTYLTNEKLKIIFPNKIADNYIFEYESYLSNKFMSVKGKIPYILCMESTSGDLIIDYKNDLVSSYPDCMALIFLRITLSLEIYNEELNKNNSSLYSIGFYKWLETQPLDDNAFRYEEKDNKIYIKGYNAISYGKYRETLIFPSTINNKEVVEVALDTTTYDMREDYFNKNVKRIIISDGIESIKTSGFFGASSLEEIILSNSLKTIGMMAFTNCKKLKKIVIPSSVIKMEFDVFHGCDNLTIYCQAKSKPSGWDDLWNNQNNPVVWGYR